MQTLRKKTSPCKYRHDPARFLGDGVVFKAKLIGILEVAEPRGDRMCQEALSDLKIAIRAAGEHKQRITIHVTLDGLRLRDEKNGDSLYHHPVHKISFIAQDMTDSRAFGYIFGAPECGHRFFGIKTEKAASIVVLAMRDLFQIVFELKKKEIEAARKVLQSRGITVNFKHTPDDILSMSPLYRKLLTETSANKIKEMSPESVADLVDLEQELSSIQRGITQMERITPSEPTASNNQRSEEDPFGDSFTQFPTYNLLPPPESSKSRHSKPLKPPEDMPSSSSASANVQTKTATPPPQPSAPPPQSSSSSLQSQMQNKKHIDDDWFIPDIDKNSNCSTYGNDGGNKVKDVDSTTSYKKPVDELENAFDGSNGGSVVIPTSDTNNTAFQYIDAFTDLDPLGTGRSKPYIDKKYFFQDLKNPPKKVLKDLSEQVFSANFPPLYGTEETRQDDDKNKNDFSMQDQSHSAPKSSLHTQKQNNEIKSTSPTADVGTASMTTTMQKADDPIIGNNKILLVSDNDPFSPRMKKFDPFEDEFAKSSIDSMDFYFPKAKSTILPDTKITSDDDDGGGGAGAAAAVTGGGGGGVSISKVHNEKRTDANGVFNGPLQVNLPPESYSAYMIQKRIDRQNSESSSASGAYSTSSMTYGTGARSRPNVFKHNTVDVINSISTKKMKPHMFTQKFSKRDTNSINMRRLQESDSLSENETAPEPPPRPDASHHMEPPPLPPKKQFSDIVIRPRVTSPLARDSQHRYEYATIRNSSSSNNNNSMTTTNTTGSLSARLSTQGENTPALPLPSRRVGRTDSNYPGPGRPSKKLHKDGDDDYLTPITIQNNDSPPILLPPPQTKTSTKNRNRRIDVASAHNKMLAKMNPSMHGKMLIKDNTNKRTHLPAAIPDITLSQLLTLGIDDLANKLNVPTSKLNTMTIVELTKYLSDYIEKSSQKSIPIGQTQNRSTSDMTAVFKVNFDQTSNATFIAKFDDNFGETVSASNDDDNNSFVPNFEQFENLQANQKQSIDKYAVFREIIDQECKTTDDDPSSMGSGEDQFSDSENHSIHDSARSAIAETSPLPTDSPIDNKITQVISKAKDRYAALRDIILVEDLFDKTTYQNETGTNDDDEFFDIEVDSNGDNIRNRQSIDDLSNTNDLRNEKKNVDDGEVINNESSSQRQTPSITLNDIDKNDLNDFCADEDDHYDDDQGVPIKQQEQKQMVLNESSSPSIFGTGKDDLEINELMNRAISNLSLDSRDHLSPILTKSPINKSQNASTSPMNLQNVHHKSPVIPEENESLENIPPSKVNVTDMSTSPIQIKKSSKSTTPIYNKSPSESMVAPDNIDIPFNAKSRRTQRQIQTTAMEKRKTPDTNGSSPEMEKLPEFQQPTLASSGGSWAVFDVDHTEEKINANVITKSINDIVESPCSSDDKNDWKAQQMYDKKWHRQVGGHHTSSSSRDQSPWDEDTTTTTIPQQTHQTAAAHHHDDYRDRIHPDRHGFYRRHAHRVKCDEECAEKNVRRERRNNKPLQSPAINKYNREQYEADWYDSHNSTQNHHSWSPHDEDEDDDDDDDDEDDDEDEDRNGAGPPPLPPLMATVDRSRSNNFERTAYERSTYGPPFEKRDARLMYDRSYGKRNYYREYLRSPYEQYDTKKYYDDYDPPLQQQQQQQQRMKMHKEYDDYDESEMNRDSLRMMHKGTGSGSGGGGGGGNDSSYFYDRDKRSFDRESMESYESNTRNRRKSFGSGCDMYGSSGLDHSRDEYARERYVSAEKLRSIRKMSKQRSQEEYDRDSDNDVDVISRKNNGDSRSLQRIPPRESTSRPRKSSGSSPWDGEDLTPTTTNAQKSWKRPASASESDRRLVESRRTLSGGSDGEKEKRFRKKNRSRTVGGGGTGGGGVTSVGGSIENEYRSNYATMRHPPMSAGHHRYDYAYESADYELDYRGGGGGGSGFGSGIPPSRRKQDFTRTLQDRRKKDQFLESNIENSHKFSRSAKDMYYSTTDDRLDKFHSPDEEHSKNIRSIRRDYEFNDFDDECGDDGVRNSGSNRGASGITGGVYNSTPIDDVIPHRTQNKFAFDDDPGFESDFNAPQMGVATLNINNNNNTTTSTSKTLRFSNDFSEKESSRSHSQQQPQQSHHQSQNLQSTNSNNNNNTPTSQKMHSIDDATKKSINNNNNNNNKSGSTSVENSMFEDDFSKAEFSYENEDEWISELPNKSNIKSTINNKRQDNIKKSESINIFAKKQEDPFEDDDFFKETTTSPCHADVQQQQQQQSKSHANFKWDKEFAKFDENM